MAMNTLITTNDRGSVRKESSRLTRHFKRSTSRSRVTTWEFVPMFMDRLSFALASFWSWLKWALNGEDVMASWSSCIVTVPLSFLWVRSYKTSTSVSVQGGRSTVLNSFATSSNSRTPLWSSSR